MDKKTYEKGLEILELYRLQNYTECQKKCKKVITMEPNSELSDLAQLTWKKIKFERYDDYQELIRGWKNPAESIAMEQNCNGDSSEAINKLNKLIGLNNVKEEIIKIQKRLELEQYRKKELNIETDIESMNFVFSGNPGTGKTTVARLLAEIFKDMGVLTEGQLVEVDRGDLVAGYIGQTAEQTKKVIERAIGGVLFIDEAYSLAQGGENDFGKEAIDALVKGMEDHRKEMVVILAGYKKEMQDLVNMNPGIESRISNYIEFPDYTEDELFEIAYRIASEKKYHFTKDGEKAFRICIGKEMVSPKFGNARTVRNVMEQAFMNKARNFNRNNTDKDYITRLDAQDFGVDLAETVSDSAQVYIDRLNSMIGLQNVKDEVNSLVSVIEYNKLLSEYSGGTNGNNFGSLHLCFTGNPGTGKTTVARLYADILKSLGVLKKGEIVEASRNDFVGQWEGHTAKKTKDICEKAYGGILFIDEAYSLVNHEQDSFGLEAVATLIKEMEDNRDKLAVIFAGYSKEMDEFMYSNSGIASRIGKTIEFPDYSYEELCLILDKYIQDEGIIAENDVLAKGYEKIKDLYDSRDGRFGNARDIRKIFEHFKRNMIERVVRNRLSGRDIKVLRMEDIV